MSSNVFIEWWRNIIFFCLSVSLIVSLLCSLSLSQPLCVFVCRFPISFDRSYRSRFCNAPSMGAFVHFPSTIRFARWHSGRKHLIDLHTTNPQIWALLAPLSKSIVVRSFVRSSARSLIVLVRRLIHPSKSHAQAQLSSAFQHIVCE